jgi:CRISPR-associated protein Cas5t
VLWLFVKAPFAAFRTFTAGAYRPTAPFITPSAAYGLVLNLAGIESRLDDGQASMTLTAPSLPRVEVALGALVIPEVQTIYQQLHNYPVGTTGRDRKSDAKGTKYNIQPIRREFLSRLEAYVGVRGNADLEARVRVAVGAATAGAAPRYGIPFLGDNGFMVDVLREETRPRPAHWYRQLSPGEGAVAGRCRLSVWIDRGDMTRTRTAIYAPVYPAVSTVPAEAWTVVEPTAGLGVE